VYVAFDVLYRFLRHLGFDVRYVRNFTDVDDKIIARAAAAGEDPLDLSGRFIHEFHKDMVCVRACVCVYVWCWWGRGRWRWRWRWRWSGGGRTCGYTRVGT
jgi:hypothetical protein